MINKKLTLTLLFILLLMVLVGCTSSYEDCKIDCKRINYDKYCQETNDPECNDWFNYPKGLENKCYNECKPK